MHAKASTLALLGVSLFTACAEVHAAPLSSDRLDAFAHLPRLPRGDTPSCTEEATIHAIASIPEAECAAMAGVMGFQSTASEECSIPKDGGEAVGICYTAKATEVDDQQKPPSGSVEGEVPGEEEEGEGKDGGRAPEGGEDESDPQQPTDPNPKEPGPTKTTATPTLPPNGASTSTSAPTSTSDLPPYATISKLPPTAVFPPPPTNATVVEVPPPPKNETTGVKGKAQADSLEWVGNSLLKMFKGLF
ncbi:hypothetical protein H0H81_001051 [Sphagnurus paluster]|uniref:Uncharacterized protein n=1 Tax=Sphagnurus paluster TaxID=117069 RepID=A0A9P7FMM7_9AGAR|nr:hypothetical protein H0H81_001051 [Sphagnurus paluster]